MKSFLPFSSHRVSTKLLGFVLALFLGLFMSRSADAVMSQYRFTAGTGSAIDMSSANYIWSGYAGARSDYGYYPTYAGYYNLGFNFKFDNVFYSQCVIYTTGMLSLGTTIVSNWTDGSLNTTNAPTIAPFWNFMFLTGHAGGCWSPSVRYITTGTAPNRVFCVEWKDWELEQWYYNRGTFQARLYESGKIEYWYDNMRGIVTCIQGTDYSQSGWTAYSSAHIGLGTSSSNYMFVKYSGATPSVATSGAIPLINVNTSSKPGQNALYTFEQLPNVQLSSSPKTVNYGTVFGGDSLTLCVTVRHAGSEDMLTFSPAVLNGSNAFSIVSSPAGPLSPGQTAQYCVKFKPSINGQANAVLSIITNGVDSGIQQINLVGLGVAPTIQLTPLGDNFVDRMFRKTRVRLGDTLEQGIIVKNIGAGQLFVFNTTGIISGDYPQYYWVSRYPDEPLLTGVSDTLFVKFAPRQDGLLPARFTINSNASNGNFLVNLAGIAVLPRVVVTPETMQFDSVAIGETVTQKFTIYNPGSDTLKLLTHLLTSADADFTMVPLSPADMIIPPERTREVPITFRPLQKGTRVARFHIVTNVPLTFENNEPFVRRDTATTALYYDIRGTGVPFGSLTSGDIRGDAALGDSSLIGVEKCRDIVITNPGDYPVTITSASFSGSSASSYQMKGVTLPFVLASKSSVTVQICGTPPARGTNEVTLTVNGTSNDRSTTLTGLVDIRGLEACATTASTPGTAFDNVKVAHNHTDSIKVEVTNCGDVPATYTPSLAGSSAGVYNVAPASVGPVAPGGIATFWVYFTPLTSGIQPATLNIAGDFVANMSVPLNGIGACAVLSVPPTTEAPATAAGSTNAFTVSISNSAGSLPWNYGTPTITQTTNAFSYTGTPGAINDGASFDLPFSFNPPGMGNFTATVTFPEAGPCGNTVTFDLIGTAGFGAVGDIRTVDGYVLSQNAPNPTNGSTSFTYTVPATGNVRIVLADVTGKVVRELINTNASIGTYTVDVNTSGLASGSYLYIMEAGNARLVRQMAVSK